MANVAALFEYGMTIDEVTAALKLEIDLVKKIYMAWKGNKSAETAI